MLKHFVYLLKFNFNHFIMKMRNYEFYQLELMELAIKALRHQEARDQLSRIIPEHFYKLVHPDILPGRFFNLTWQQDIDPILRAIRTKKWGDVIALVGNFIEFTYLEHEELLMQLEREKEQDEIDEETDERDPSGKPYSETV